MVFDQYLRTTMIPVFEYKVEGTTLSYRWTNAIPGFNMPIKVGTRNRWQTLTPTTDWKVMTTTLKKEEFEVATELYYVNVSKQ